MYNKWRFFFFNGYNGFNIQIFEYILKKKKKGIIVSEYYNERLLEVSGVIIRVYFFMCLLFWRFV